MYVWVFIVCVSKHIFQGGFSSLVIPTSIFDQLTYLINETKFFCEVLQKLFRKTQRKITSDRRKLIVDRERNFWYF